jgi:RNA polymerase sigma factor (sigma-70 family)
MTGLLPAIVLFGDVVDSRGDAGASAFLRGLRDELEVAYAGERLAPAGFTQGDEIQLLLAPAADPFQAIVRASLRPAARELRWAVVAGEVEAGSGPATERTGPAFHAARGALEQAKSRREGLVALTGDPAADRLLADIGPLFPALLAELTARQREVARLVLVDGLRRSEIAERLGVSRATVSVIAARARVQHLGRLADALATVFRGGAASAGSGAALVGSGRHHRTGSAA